MRRKKGISESNNFLTKELSSVDSVLPRKYSSTVKGVLQYFQGSTPVLPWQYWHYGKFVVALITECLDWNCFILVYPFSR